jgi:ribosomal protein S18 acetylase RimI-like enzyme
VTGVRDHSDSWVATTASRCADAEPLLAQQRGEIGAASGNGTMTSAVHGVRVVGVPNIAEPWATSAYLLDGPPEPSLLAEVMTWLRVHASPGAEVSVVTRRRHADAPAWAAAGLRVWEEQPVFVATAADAAGLRYPVPDDVTVREPTSREEFWQGYGCWLGDLDASAIMPASAFGRRDLGLLVAVLDGAAVGSAILRWVAGTGYLGGIGVRADLRGRGIGGALTAEATRRAAAGPAGAQRDAAGRPIDLVWMHASSEGAPMYARLGFTEVDQHVILAG